MSVAPTALAAAMRSGLVVDMDTLSGHDPEVPFDQSPWSTAMTDFWYPTGSAGPRCPRQRAQAGSTDGFGKSRRLWGIGRSHTAEFEAASPVFGLSEARWCLRP